MRRCIPFLFLWAGVGLGGDAIIAEFRLQSEPGTVQRGWITDRDEDCFEFERFGDQRKRLIPWGDLVDQDRIALRRRVGRDQSEDARLGLVAGHRLQLDRGAAIEGVLERIDAEGRHWLRRHGMLLPYPSDCVRRVEEVKVRESEVYDEEELYRRTLERMTPETARQHRDLADQMYDVGNLTAARRHYAAAAELEPSWRRDLQSRVDQVDELLGDADAARALRKARATYRLHGDYPKARLELGRFVAEHPDRRRAGLQALDALETQFRADQRARFCDAKHHALRRALDDFLKKQPSLQEALSWVRGSLQEEITGRVAELMELTAGEVGAFLGEKGGGAPHWASYWSGTFVIDRRAKIGKPTSMTIRGDPDEWWNRYGDSSTRTSFLCAYAAERLPELFEVVEVRLKDCPSCGGTGRVRNASVGELNAVGGAGHEWLQLCKRCYGAAQDRSVCYR